MNFLETHQALGRDLFVATNPTLLQAREEPVLAECVAAFRSVAAGAVVPADTR
jgi:hypothetical protein